MRIAGILFCFAGVLTSIVGLVGGGIRHIPIAMMFVCIGLMLTVIGRRR